MKAQPAPQTVGRQPHVFDMPRRKPTFEGFMDYLSRKLDDRETTQEQA